MALPYQPKAKAFLYYHKHCYRQSGLTQLTVSLVLNQSEVI